MKKNKLILNAVIGGLLGINGIHSAEAASEKDKDAKIEALEQRLLLLEERLGRANTNNPPVNETVHKLDQQVKVLQRQSEIDKEVATAAAKTAAKVDLGRNGFNFESADGNFSFKPRALIQAQSRWFHDDGSVPTANPVDSYELRRARLAFTGKLYKNFDYTLMTEFGGSGSPTIYDAYIGYKLIPELSVRAGRFIVPFGFEQIQSAGNLTFVERSLASNLVPNRDNGVEFYGDIGAGLVEYEIGVGNGVRESGTDFVNNDPSDDKEFFGRVFAAPFVKTNIAALKNLRFGVSGTSGEQAGALTQTYATAGRQTFFSYNAGVNADGNRYRVSPHVFYNYGPFGLLGEYVLNSQQAVLGANKDRLDNTAWNITASYVLTGEKLDFKSGYPSWNTGLTVVPANEFDPLHGKWGAIQVATRLSQLNIDQGTFSRGYASRAVSARNANAWELGLNWYLNNNVSASLSYEQTRFDGGAAGGRDRDTENAVLSRVQLQF